MANHRSREVADLLHFTSWFAFHTGQWEHRDWAIAARAAGCDAGRTASTVVTWWNVTAQSDALTDELPELDPTAADLLARDLDRIWLARASIAFLTSDPDGAERATAWLDEREPRCHSPITEAWLISNLINATLSSPDSALVARLHRLGHASPSPSVRAIAGFTLHGNRYLNPRLGEDLELGDIIDGLQRAGTDARTAGNLIVESICLTLAAIPLTAAADRAAATELRAIIERIQEVHFDLALTTTAAIIAVWFVRIGRPDTGLVVDAWLRSHVTNPHQALQPALQQLEQLLGEHDRERAAQRLGATMTHPELIDYLRQQLSDVINVASPLADV